ncbi:MAG: SIR2 family protein [Methylococcales bacterium]|nr:SIR2 family protein [Methylococcales bacterium]MDD5630414.1 SIR2 family protein [Methylococcales bacterium]
MTDLENNTDQPLAKNFISFIQGQDSLLNNDDLLDIGIEKIRNKVADLSNVKNIHFLLGAGASSNAIPAMKEMMESIKKNLNVNKPELKERFEKITGNNIDNLEEILGILYSHRAYLVGTGESDEITTKLIELIENEIFDKINISFEAVEAKISLDIYKKFYQKLSLRNRDLSRVNVFTTNNDLLSEKSLDHLNINYNNGFGGGLDRVFNPARFSYTFSRKVDSGLEKYEPLDNMVYLYKLHGSISWVESEDNSFFNIKEIPIKHGDPRPKTNVLIYPTPLKQNKSLGAPYSDLIREFQKKLLLQHSVLFIIGYSFSDEHINNVIYQALSSNSSISIVVFGNYSDKPIFKVEDRRVYKVYGEISKDDDSDQKVMIHYFQYIVDKFIPDLDEHREVDILKYFIENLAKAKTENGSKSK